MIDLTPSINNAPKTKEILHQTRLFYDFSAFN